LIVQSITDASLEPIVWLLTRKRALTFVISGSGLIFLEVQKTSSEPIFILDSEPFFPKASSIIITFVPLSNFL
jgi:hypothetical protein